MFVKGMKYEIRSVARIVLPMLIVLLCAAMLMSLGFMLDGRVFGFTRGTQTNETAEELFALTEALLGMGLVFLMVAINISVFVLVIRRFYVSFFTDEGYLTFTLPVSMDCHLMVKIVSMFFWNFVSLIATLLAGLIIFGGLAVGYSEQMEGFFSNLSAMFRLIWNWVGVLTDHPGEQMVVAGVSALFHSIFQSLLLYFSITLGAMLFKKHRMLGAIICVFVIDNAFSVVLTIGSSLLQTFGIVSEWAYLIVSGFNVLLTVAAILALYYGMRYILQKKLNLD